MKYLEQYLETSPIRALDNILNANNGNKIFMLASKQGLGKTSLITQIAIDKMFNEKEIIHISLKDDFKKTILWYDYHFDLLKKEIILDEEKSSDIYYKKRMLLSLNKTQMGIKNLYSKIETIKNEVLPNVSIIFIDGFDFVSYSNEDIALLKQLNLEIWFTISLNDNSNYQILDSLKKEVDEVLFLEQKDNSLVLRLDGDDKALEIDIDNDGILLNS